MKNRPFPFVVFWAILAIGAPAQIRPVITANELKADVSFLASDALQGRGTPSPGLDIASEYIAAQFRRAGLETAGDDGFFQTAEYQSLAPNPEAPELTLELGGKTYKADSAAMSIQEPAAADLNRVPIIRIALNDSAALDALSPESVRGKALLVDIPDGGGAAFAGVRRFQATAARLAPALVIFSRSSASNTGSRARLREASARSLGIPMLMLWDPALRGALGGSGNAVVSVHIPPPVIQAVKLRNVIGLLRGSDPIFKDTYVVLSAHYDHLGVRGTGEGDHIYNGANDDASGTASVIGAARALAALRERPKRSIVFLAFFGEEAGGLGSHYYCQHPVFPLSKTVADINLEQLGRTDDLEGPRLLQFNLTGFDYTNIASIFLKAGGETGVKVLKHEKNSDNYFAASDNASFAEAGVPSTTISVSYVFPDYHKAGDEWPKLDYENMSKVDASIVLGLFRIAESTEEPQWNANNPKVARFIQARKKTGQ
jgi:hypothetical protein